MAKLAGKVAFITGTAQGTGRAAARLFAAEGAIVVGCDLKVPESLETVALVQASGGRIHSFHPVDLTDRDQAHAWVAQGIALAGGIDILFNNAAAPRFAPFETMSPEDWAYTFRNEVDLLFHVTQAAWPHLRQRGGGAVINMASQSGLMGDQSGMQSAHAATKGAVIALTRQLAAEGAQHRIRVNSISPGALQTPAAQWTADRAEQVRAAIPLGRAGTAEDIAPCALFLASDDSSFATGANFVIDGGRSSIWRRAG